MAGGSQALDVDPWLSTVTCNKQHQLLLPTFFGDMIDYPDYLNLPDVH